MSKYIISKKMAIEMMAWILGLVVIVAILNMFV